MTEEEAKAKAEADARAKAEADAAAAAAAADEDGDDGDEFDKDRALETIRKQRESEKKAKDELKAARARLKELEEAEKKRQDADKSELEKATSRVSELEKALQDSREMAQALRLRQEFGKVAKKLNLKFADVQAEDDAFLLAEMEGVEMDADGEVTGLEDAVKALHKSRPYLFAKAEGGDGNGTPQRNGKGGQGKLNQDVLKGVKVRF